MKNSYRLVMLTALLLLTQPTASNALLITDSYFATWYSGGNTWLVSPSIYWASWEVQQTAPFSALMLGGNIIDPQSLSATTLQFYTATGVSAWPFGDPSFIPAPQQTPIPEPTTALLLVSGLVALLQTNHLRRK